MSNENNINSFSAKVDTGMNARSTSLDLQQWSQAWEEAYLSLQTNSQNETSPQQKQVNSQGDENQDQKQNTPKLLSETTAQSFQNLNLAKEANGPVVNKHESHPLPLQSNLSLAKSTSNNFGLADARLSPNSNNSRAPLQIDQSYNFSKPTKSEISKSGFHVYVTENGEIRVWLRNQALNVNAGLTLLQKLRNSFNQLGYTLDTFSLNGEAIFVRNDGQGDQAVEQTENSNQPFIDKSY